MQRCPHCNDLHDTNVLFCPATGQAISVSRIGEGEVVEGKYRIVRRIASGGMGAIYEVEHLRISKRFAMKLLLPELAGNAEITQRFEREAKAASAIGHPNIIEITDMGTTDDGLQFIVMELLTGQDMAALIAEAAPLSPARGVEIMAQVLLALEAAHSVGIIHRDLKPENVFLSVSPTGQEIVKLLDFGISKIANTDEAKLRLTSTGLILGTPFYMSPEQAKGLRDIDHRSDLYAAGVILFEALTGSRPYEADNLNNLIYQILAGEIRRPSSLAPEIPSDVENVILRALATDKDERFQSAAGFRQALLGETVVERPASMGTIRPPSAAQTGPGDMFTPTLPADTATPVMANGRTPVTQAVSRRKPWPLVAGLAVLLAVAITLAMLYLPDRGARGSASGDQARSGAPDAAPTTSTDASAGNVAASMGNAPQPRRTATIRISVDLKPADATLLLGGKRIPSNPFTLPADGKRHLLVAKAEGYEPETMKLLADQSQRIQMHLDKKTTKGTSRRRRRRRPPSMRPRVRPRTMSPGMKVIKISTDID